MGTASITDAHIYTVCCCMIGTAEIMNECLHLHGIMLDEANQIPPAQILSPSPNVTRLLPSQRPLRMPQALRAILSQGLSDVSQSSGKGQYQADYAVVWNKGNDGQLN